MRKLSTVQVEYADTIMVYLAHFVKLPSEPTEFLLLCDWCNKYVAIPQVDYIQASFISDAHNLVCYCPDCKKATVYQYESE